MANYNSMLNTIVSQQCIDKGIIKKNNNTDKIIHKLGTNILKDHTTLSYDTCAMTKPVRVNLKDTRIDEKDKMQTFLNIQKDKCIDKYNEINKENKDTIELTNAIMKQSSSNLSLNDIIQNCDLRRIVKDNDNNIMQNESAETSFIDVLTTILNDLPFRLISSMQLLKEFIDNRSKIENMFIKINTGTRCIDVQKTLQNIDVISYALLIPKYNRIIEQTIKLNSFFSITDEQASNYWYLSNPGDGDCLFIATVKFIYMLSNINRSYPDYDSIRYDAEILRYEVAKYIFNNRYKLHTLYNNMQFETEINEYVLESIEDQLNIVRKAIKNNVEIKNPTTYSYKHIRDNFNNLEPCVRYSIVIAQHGTLGGEFISAWGGVYEIVAISYLLNRSVIVYSGMKNKKLYRAYSKILQDDTAQCPILIYFHLGRHYECIFPRKFGKPYGSLTYPSSVSMELGPPDKIKEGIYYNNPGTFDFVSEVQPFNLYDILLSKLNNDYVLELPNIFIKASKQEHDKELPKSNYTEKLEYISPLPYLDTLNDNKDSELIKDLIKLTSGTLSRDDIIDILGDIRSEADDGLLSEKDIRYIFSQVVKLEIDYSKIKIDNELYLHIGSYLYKNHYIEEYLNILKQHNQDDFEGPININLLSETGKVIILNLSSVIDNKLFQTFIDNKIILDPITVNKPIVELPDIHILSSLDNNDELNE